MRFDRMDRAALSTAAALAFLTLVVIWRGDRVGVRVTQVTPADGARFVAARQGVALTFSEAMDRTSVEARMHITPAVSGTLQWNGTTLRWKPTQPLMPGTYYTFTLEAGARSVRGRQLLEAVQVAFRVAPLRVAWLAPADGSANLFVLDLSQPEAAPVPITSEPFGLYDYAVSPDGTRIAYSANRAATDSERDLWLINADGSGRTLLVQCDSEVCQAPSWSGDGAVIAFERRPLIAGAVGRAPGPGRIWLYDTQTEQAAPLFADTQRLGSLPRFAPADRWLAFYDPLESAVVVLDMLGNAQVLLPSALGDSGAWSPDGRRLLYPDLVAVDNEQYAQLVVADIETEIITPVLPLTRANLSSAAWSPLGDWIAFGYQLSPAIGGAGVQVWRARTDGSEATPLTQDSSYTYGAISWSPDGTWLLAQRFYLPSIEAKPEVWLIRADGSERRLLARNAAQPAWMP
ncbi:MAG: Ig-like domain-containing protein [Thermoflexales bacterium]|nr:Ig-like domain-containing protein [Thermoflexales bacterium]